MKPIAGGAVRTTVLLAMAGGLAGGLAVASVYDAPPLLDLMADGFGICRGAAGIVVAATQARYGLGLALVVPLGDRLDRRRLIVGQLGLLGLALTAVAAAPSGPWLLRALAVVGVLAVVTQVLVAHAAGPAGPERRGAAIETVTGRIVLGILLALLPDRVGRRSGGLDRDVRRRRMGRRVCAGRGDQPRRPGVRAIHNAKGTA